MSRKCGSTATSIPDIQSNSGLYNRRDKMKFFEVIGRSPFYERAVHNTKRDEELEKKAKICLGCKEENCKGICERVKRGKSDG